MSLDGSEGINRSADVNGFQVTVPAALVILRIAAMRLRFGWRHICCMRRVTSLSHPRCNGAVGSRPVPVRNDFSVPSPQAKLILALTVLVAWFEPGNRAEGGFAFSEFVLTSERSQDGIASGLPLIRNEDGTLAPVASLSSGGMGETDSVQPFNDGSPEPFLQPPAWWPALTGRPTGGASAPGTSPSGVGSGTGLPFILPVDPHGDDTEVTGSLRLADKQFKPPPFRVRLFRPPR